MAGALSIIQVNVGEPRLLARVHDENIYSGISKGPVKPGTKLWLSLHNLSGDGQADITVHGGPDKAVYAYPSEHLPLWEEELCDTFGPAPFGENLSTRGMAEADVCIGDRWRWDQAVLEVCQPRWPCFKLAIYRQRRDIQLRMKANGRTGWYLRVVEPGEVTVGSPVEVVERDGAGLTVSDAHQAMADRHLQNRELVEALARHGRLADAWSLPLRERLDAAGSRV
jgi:MOSC domain-containing protein YiiM